VPVDPFVLVMLGVIVALVLWVLLVGKFAPGSGLEQIGWKSAQEVTERREALDAEDLQQMVAARNARRRARGEREVSLDEIEMQVMADAHEQRRQRERYLAERRDRQLDERDLDELLELSNARRRARGLPERTREEVSQEFGDPRPASPDA
jgi:hypothetical protein